MTKKNIRSKYIKNLLGESKELTKELEETTKQTLKDILKETVNAEFRSILNEAPEQDYEEEEVNAANEPVAGAQADPNAVGEPAPEAPATPGLEGGMESAEPEPEMGAATPDGNEGEADEIWNSLEQYKGEDGEYDLTGMDAQSAARVLKVMDPEKDGIRVVKDGNKVELTDDNTDAEYIIELEPEEENVYDIEMEEPTMAESENHGNVGYMGNKYQKQTAMTTPDNHEPSPMKGYRDWDNGAPHGTEKPYGKSKGNGKPYGKNGDELEEGIIIEVEECDGMDEVRVDGGARTMEGPSGDERKKRYTGLRKREPVSRNSTDKEEGRADEAIKRKANEIFMENRELKKVASKIKDRLEESYLMNYNLGKIVKIITENSTTRDEKINIVNRFNDVKSIEESKQLYETISRELATTKETSNVDSVMNGQAVNESRQWKPSVVETSMYRSEDLHDTLDLMERMERLDNRKKLL